MFYFRLAYVLKITLEQALQLPRWEVEAWRALFDVYGPIDWKRNDYNFAAWQRFNSVEERPLRDFMTFVDPSIKRDLAQERNEREKKLMGLFCGRVNTDGE